MATTAEQESHYQPKCVVLVSGKRKSGKDYVSEILYKKLLSSGHSTALLRVAAPIKMHWARANNLDYNRLLGSSNYKEIYRKAMLQWGCEQRDKDYGIFCRDAITMSNAEDKDIWIVADTRYKTDFQWFIERYQKITRTVRMISTAEVRSNRGWVYTDGVDNDPSECAMDDFHDWDFEILNNGDEKQLEDEIGRVLAWIQQCVTDSIYQSVS